MTPAAREFLTAPLAPIAELPLPDPATFTLSRKHNKIETAAYETIKLAGLTDVPLP